MVCCANSGFETLKIVKSVFEGEENWVWVITLSCLSPPKPQRPCDSPVMTLLLHIGIFVFFQQRCQMLQCIRSRATFENT